LNYKINQPLRPTQHVESALVTAILNGTYPAGSVLPSERALAERLGVTRPTLRETLQRLANEGWIEIRHGKPTSVNNYWQKGGLSLLGTLAKYAEFLPKGFITHLLEVRVTLLPPIARLAANHHPRALLDYLRRSSELPQDAASYAVYDWKLQMLMARHSDNPVFPLIFNDFASIFQAMAIQYFAVKKARRASGIYYQKLYQAIEQGGETVAGIVKDAMRESMVLWHDGGAFTAFK